MNQDANVYISRLKKDEALPFTVDPKRRLWMQVGKGSITANGETLEAGDGLATKELSQLNIQATTQSEIIIFDLA
ncbi:Quercetin 2,3-dioxygenase [compost metagenome]